jgi:adenosylhomocysteinase
MDLGLALEARSLATVAAGGLVPGVQPVPADLDRTVARAFVAARMSLGPQPQG